MKTLTRDETSCIIALAENTFSTAHVDGYAKLRDEMDKGGNETTMFCHHETRKKKKARD